MTETLSSLAFWWDFLVSYESKRFSLLKQRKLEKSNQTNHLVHWVSYLFIHFWRQMHPNVYLPIFADEQPAELQDGLTSGSGSQGHMGGQLMSSLLFTFATFNVLKHATSPFPRLQWWQTLPLNKQEKIYKQNTYFEMKWDVSFCVEQQKYRKSPTRNTSKRVLKKLFWYVRLDVPRSKRVSFSLSFLPKSPIRKTVFVAQKTFAIRRIFLMLIGSASQCSKLLHTVGYSFYIIASDFLDTSSIKLLTWPWEKKGEVSSTSSLSL
mgnify:CR=1 FL=1